MLQFLRQYSQKIEITNAKSWLQHIDASKIPTSDFEISYSRASGPGGQKVNKTSSKVTVSMSADKWLNPNICYWIPPPIRSQLQDKKIRYETKSGGILIQSDSSRNRDINTIHCFEKLIEEIKAITYFRAEVSEEDQKKWQDINKQTKERRLLDKKKQSEKRKTRSKNFDI